MESAALVDFENAVSAAKNFRFHMIYFWEWLRINKRAEGIENE